VETPPLVARATALARDFRFEKSCSPQVGRLLHVLAGARGRERVGEIGTGCGVGAAWMVSALDPATPFVTVERDATLAEAAAGLFAGDERVRVLHGDWRELLSTEAPFDLLFVDGGKANEAGPEVVSLLAPRGIAVLDDLTPGRESDPVRDFWLREPGLAAVELLTTPGAAAILAVRAL
jgi:predicted O-methyltransferase YrrM